MWLKFEIIFFNNEIKYPKVPYDYAIDFKIN